MEGVSIFLPFEFKAFDALPQGKILDKIDIIDKYKNVKVRLPRRDFKTYDDTDFKATLERTWAVVNHSSNPAMEAVINGIPVFVSEDSLCHDVGNIGYADINTPAMPGRQKWANKLAYTEWFEDEIKQGIPWKRIKARLEEKYL